MNFQFSNSGGRSKKTPGVFGKMGISLFLSVFLALGLFFFYMLGLEVISRASVFSWEKTQCHIQSSSIGQQSGDKQHVLRVKYSYEYKGVRYESDRFSMDDPEYDKYSKASQAIAPYEQGSTTDCYVNPKSPSEAVLSRGGLWIALFLLIPLIFIAVGGGGIYAVWTTSNDTAKSRYAKRATSRSASSNSWVGVIFGGVFFLVGLGLFYPFFVLPLMNLSDSQSWTPTDCTVISSSVKSHHSDDGTTYSVEIFYRYEVNGTTYKSDRYEFFGGSSSGYDSKKKVVRDHPPGKTFTCYVNPEAPSEAVINRGFSWSFLLGLIPLIFMAVGLAVMFLLGKTQKSTALPTHAREASTSFSFAEPLELKPTSSRMGKLLGITFAALFWNGIVSVFLYHVWESWSSGSPEWFLTIFLIPFVLVGLALLFGIVHSFLSLFNPIPFLTLEDGRLVLGGETKLLWRIEGKVERLTRFAVRLEGVEEATYRRGTNTYTDRSTFYRATLFETTHHREMTRGETLLRIPDDLMHTFTSSNNKIVWKIIVVGEIPKWPDISRDHVVVIHSQGVTV